LVKRLFGGNSDTILSQIRRTFTSDVTKEPIRSEITSFPIETINNEIRRNAGISDEFIEDLLNTQINEHYSFSLLALLYPNLDYKNNNFHKDHLHPVALYSKLSEEDKIY